MQKKTVPYNVPNGGSQRIEILDFTALAIENQIDR
jgi:hypothetical protein